METVLIFIMIALCFIARYLRIIAIYFDERMNETDAE